MTTRKTAADKRVDRLFDYAADRPEGFTRDDVLRDVGWNGPVLSSVARGLRALCAAPGGTMTLVVTPQSKGAPWLYKLVEKPEDAHDHQRRRIETASVHVTSALQAVAPIAAGADKRTAEGKQLVRMERSLVFLAAELADVADLSRA